MPARDQEVDVQSVDRQVGPGGEGGAAADEEFMSGPVTLRTSLTNSQ